MFWASAIGQNAFAIGQIDKGLECLVYGLGCSRISAAARPESLVECSVVR